MPSRKREVEEKTGGVTECWRSSRLSERARSGVVLGDMDASPGRRFSHFQVLPGGHPMSRDKILPPLMELHLIEAPINNLAVDPCPLISLISIKEMEKEELRPGVPHESDL